MAPAEPSTSAPPPAAGGDRHVDVDGVPVTVPAGTSVLRAAA
jgi:hypothetical protein